MHTYVVCVGARVGQFSCMHACGYSTVYFSFPFVLRLVVLSETLQYMLPNTDFNNLLTLFMFF